MRKLRLLLAGVLALWALPALAVDSVTLIGNANYSVLSTDTKLVPSVAISANRTWTLPSAGATCIGQTCGQARLEILDTQGNVGGANACILVAPASGETINGSSSSLSFCSAYGRVILYPLTGTSWLGVVQGAGQTQGTTTNDNAQPGYVGEVISSTCPGPATTTTITVTIAAPGVVTWAAHGFTTPCPVVFTTSGALPTGITSGTTYYVVPSSITTNTFQIATTIANALAGTSITTSGTQSGTQTGTAGVALATTTAADVTGISLTAGDWDCRAVIAHATGSSFAATVLKSGINATSATIPAQGILAAHYFQTASNVMGALGEDMLVGPVRISLAATTTEFLSEQDTFSTGTNVGFGQIVCRRAR